MSWGVWEAWEVWRALPSPAGLWGRGTLRGRGSTLVGLDLIVGGARTTGEGADRMSIFRSPECKRVGCDKSRLPLQCALISFLLCLAARLWLLTSLCSRLSRNSVGRRESHMHWNPALAWRRERRTMQESMKSPACSNKGGRGSANGHCVTPQRTPSWLMEEVGVRC